MYWSTWSFSIIPMLFGVKCLRYTSIVRQDIKKMCCFVLLPSKNNNIYFLDKIFCWQTNWGQQQIESIVFMLNSKLFFLVYRLYIYYWKTDSFKQNYKIFNLKQIWTTNFFPPYLTRTFRIWYDMVVCMEVKTCSVCFSLLSFFAFCTCYEGTRWIKVKINMYVTRFEFKIRIHLLEFPIQI